MLQFNYGLIIDKPNKNWILTHKINSFYEPTAPLLKQIKNCHHRACYFCFGYKLSQWGQIILIYQSCVCPSPQNPEWSLTDSPAVSSVNWQDSELVRSDFSSWEIFQIFSFQCTFMIFIHSHSFHCTNSWEKGAWWDLY